MFTFSIIWNFVTIEFMYKKTVSLKLVIGCNTGCISVISYDHLIQFQRAQNVLIAFYI